MKKTYQKPETQAYAIQVTLLNDPSLPVNSGKTITDPTQIQSRRHYSVWGDDEDNEEW